MRNGFDAYAATNQPRQVKLTPARDLKLQLGGKALIKGVLDQQQTSLILGATQTGKTFLAIDASLHISTAISTWFGHRVVEGGVVYIAAEAGLSIGNRVGAWKLAHGYDIDANFPFSAVTHSIDLCHHDAGELDSLINAINAAKFDCLRLIVIDTISRVLFGGNENSPEDMGAVVASMDRLRDEFKCHVSGVHHFGKDSGRGPRGHSLLEANLDTVIEVQRDKTTKISTATVTKQRDGELGKAIAFRLRSIELARDEDGDPVTSCIVDRADDQTHHMPVELIEKEKLTRSEGLALQAMTNAINIGGTVPPASNHIPHQTRCVTEALWHDYCRNGAISNGGDRAERKAFRNAAEGLLAKNQIGKWGDWVWPK